MSRTFKSAFTALALILCFGLTASAAESYGSTDIAGDVSRYFANIDAASTLPAEEVKQESEKYLTLGELDLSTIRNVLRRTAPMPSGLPTNDTPAPVYVEAAPVVYAPVVVRQAAPVIVSSSTDADCLPCQKARRFRR